MRIQLARDYEDLFRAGRVVALDEGLGLDPVLRPVPSGRTGVTQTEKGP